MVSQHNVLVVDDEPEVCDMLMEQINAAGWHCNVVYDGDAALDELYRHSYEMAFLDINLPGKSGLDVLRDLYLHKAETKVVVISGMDMAAPAVDAIRFGAVDYITKPFELSKIREILTGFLDEAGGVRNGAAREGIDCKLDALAECFTRKLEDVIDIKAIAVDQVSDMAIKHGLPKRKVKNWASSKTGDGKRSAAGSRRTEKRSPLSRSISDGLRPYMDC